VFISCLCITRSRREWLPQAIRCFHSQTYDQKELIILADTYEDVAGVRQGEGVRVFIGADPSLTIGAKRNLAAKLTTRWHPDDMLCNFDDDDFSGPERLDDQCWRLQQAGAAVTGYRDIKFTDGTQWWMNRNWPGGYGSTLLYRRDWFDEHPYPDIHVGEDWGFVETAMQAGRFAVGEARDHFHATIHSQNTAPRVIGAGWEPIEAPVL
jgi:glycosyltransferase involved in cell wall biosynthesis